MYACHCRGLGGRHVDPVTYPSKQVHQRPGVWPTHIYQAHIKYSHVSRLNMYHMCITPLDMYHM